MSDRYEPTGPAASRRKSLFSLLGDVPGLVGELVRSEIDLLKAELVGKAKAAGVGAALLAVAAVVALLAAGVLLTTIILALSLVMPGWLAALIVLLLLLVVVAVLAWLGLRELRKSSPPVPEQTLASLRRDMDTIRGFGKRAQP